MRTKNSKVSGYTGEGVPLSRTKAEHLLAAMSLPNALLDLSIRLAVVTAHPDDETLGFGGQLNRIRNISVVVVTDGAPHNNVDARLRGFPNWTEHAIARQSELDTAMRIAGISPADLVSLNVPDKEAALHLPDITRQLAQIFFERSVDVIVTHAFEGGHADHDATAFAVHAATALCRREHSLDCAIIEMPFYYWADGVFVRQKFPYQNSSPVIEIRLKEDLLSSKKKLLLAYESQSDVLNTFDHHLEHFRFAMRPEFATRPGISDSGYYRITPLITFDRWIELVRHADHALQLRGFK